MTGKELGIAVAKEVMGWTVIERWEMHGYGGACPVAVIPANAEIDSLSVYAEDVNVFTKSWAPWRDMNDCMEVDSKNWLWDIREHQMGVDARLTVLYPENEVFTTVLWGEFGRIEMRCHARLQAALASVRGEQT